jgi:hypothetical protein
MNPTTQKKLLKKHEKNKKKKPLKPTDISFRKYQNNQNKIVESLKKMLIFRRKCQ